MQKTYAFLSIEVAFESQAVAAFRKKLGVKVDEVIVSHTRYVVGYDKVGFGLRVKAPFVAMRRANVSYVVPVYERIFIPRDKVGQKLFVKLFHHRL